jgi:hypothetical protein
MSVIGIESEIRTIEITLPPSLFPKLLFLDVREKSLARHWMLRSR